MDIHFLGTGTPSPDPNRGSSAILVGTGSSRLLLDCGRNCVQQMAILGIAPSSVTHVFLTHGHFDHVADFALLVLSSWRFGRHHILKVYGPPGTKAMSDAWFQEVYKIDIAARKNLGKKESANDINIEVRELRNGDIVEEDGWQEFGFSRALDLNQSLEHRRAVLVILLLEVSTGKLVLQFELELRVAY